MTTRNWILLGALCAVPVGLGGGMTPPRAFDAEAAYERFAGDGDRRARAELLAAAEAGRLDALGWQRVGLLLLHEQQERAAAGALEIALELDDGLGRSWMGLEHALRALGRSEEAGLVADQQPGSGSDPAHARILEAWQREDFEQVLRLARRARVDARGQPFEVTALAHEVDALVALGATDAFEPLERRLRFELRATPGLRPAIEAHEYEHMERAVLAAWGSGRLGAELSERGCRSLCDSLPALCRDER